MNIQNTPTTPLKKWTILNYSAADNNLKAYMMDDVDEMERVGSDSTTDLLVQQDQGGKVGAMRLHLQADAKPGINSPVVQKMGSINMSAPSTLADFVEWGIKNYPAEHYMVVIADHGDGWKGAVQDLSHNGWMSLEDIQTGLRTARERTGVTPDILGFDACNMAATEVAYQLRDEASVLIASEKTEGGGGWPYSPWLGPKTLNAMRTMLEVDGTPQEVAQSIVRAATNRQEDIETLSATDLKKMGPVAEAVKGLAQKVTATDTPSAVLKKLAGTTQDFEGHKDLVDFCKRVVASGDVKDEALKKAAGQVMEAVGKAVFAEQHSTAHPGATGLTLEIPTYSTPGSAYNKLELSQFTGWPAAQQKIVAKA